MESHPSQYDCTRCGACCRSFPIFAGRTDAIREPRIRDEARKLPEHLRTETMTFQLFPLPFHSQCPFLQADELCRIYDTRPEVCRRFEPGSRQCIEARERHRIHLKPKP